MIFFCSNVNFRPNVVAGAKHFVGDGGIEGGVNEHNTLETYYDLFQIHMCPYLYSLEKDEHGFKGFIISDWEGIDRITSPGSNYSYSVSSSINAGMDMVMVPFKFENYISNLIELVNSGQISMSIIDDAIRRILRVKFIVGFFKHPKTDRSLLGMVGNPVKIAREAVRKSLVLLKNRNGGEKPLLPLNKNTQKILVAGTHADNLGYQCGGWTISWAGNNGSMTVNKNLITQKSCVNLICLYHT
ncbi:hypothetical protein SUGI_1451010 [Cryptomeria japonica]|uniref:Glycoside hydrolase family 3 N-terminal domain-containing protein n=1 Tax=Cryptomeria japonica TaxID=3369 RepID=A0AAD3NUS7_CRYJA|nr:hypothetical protein SUGI_1451010 [Cryptomeria japonica]